MGGRPIVRQTGHEQQLRIAVEDGDVRWPLGGHVM
jgi:hypothetical protein